MFDFVLFSCLILCFGFIERVSMSKLYFKHGTVASAKVAVIINIPYCILLLKRMNVFLDIHYLLSIDTEFAFCGS